MDQEFPRQGGVPDYMKMKDIGPSGGGECTSLVSYFGSANAVSNVIHMSQFHGQEHVLFLKSMSQGKL